MSICNGDNERKLKINGIFLSPRGITLPKIIRPDPNLNSTCVFSWTNLCTKFHLKISMYDLDNERKLNRKDGMTEGRNDGMTEWRKGVTLYAPAILWRGHKKHVYVYENMCKLCRWTLSPSHYHFQMVKCGIWKFHEPAIVPIELVNIFLIPSWSYIANAC